MATHSKNNAPSTAIVNSDVVVDTLNINKTSTQQEIIDNLPRQHSLDYANKTSDNIYPVSPLIKEGFEPFVTLYINGTKVPKVETNDVNLDGFYIFPARNQIRVLGSFVSSISSSASVYLFYTEQSA